MRQLGNVKKQPTGLERKLAALGADAPALLLGDFNVPSHRDYVGGPQWQCTQAAEAAGFHSW